jgi:hypothetical protein
VNLNDLRERILDQAKNVRDRVEQSAIYNNLRERFEVLPARTQQLVVVGGLGLVALTLVYLPLSFLWSASSKISEYEETRSLLSDLMQTAGMDDLSQLAPAISADQMRAMVDQALAEQQLTPEQIESIAPTESESGASLIPSSVKNVAHQSLSVSLKKLNVKQIEDIGYRLQNLQQRDIKLTTMRIDRVAQDKAGYFDVEFHLTNFSIPSPLLEGEGAPDAAAPNPRRPRPSRPSRGGG